LHFYDFATLRNGGVCFISSMRGRGERRPRLSFLNWIVTIVILRIDMRYALALGISLLAISGLLGLIQIRAETPPAPPAGTPPATGDDLPTFQLGILVGEKPWDMTSSWTVDGADRAGTQTVEVHPNKNAAIRGIILKNTSKLQFDFQYTCTYEASSLNTDKTETRNGGDPCPNVSPVQSLSLNYFKVRLSPGTYGGNVFVSCWPRDAMASDNHQCVSPAGDWLTGLQITVQPPPPKPH
jgi:hypothetical protein